MSVTAAVNGGLAALDVAIAYYAHFYVPHSPEVHYTGKYGEVIASAATYVGVLPAFQVCMFVVSVIGRWGANRPHFGQRIITDPDLLYRSVSFLMAAAQLFVLMATAYFAVRLAIYSV